MLSHSSLPSGGPILLKVFKKEKGKEERTKVIKKNRRYRAEATNVVILALKTNIGDGRQEAREQMGNKN